MPLLFLLSGSSSSSGGFPGSGFGMKSGPSAAPKGAGGPQWQQSGGSQAGAGKGWMPPASAAKPQPPKPAPQPNKPNYNVNFSVIGGREERGIRGPGFGTSRKIETSPMEKGRKMAIV